jgi:hypothetical protein
MKGLFASLFAFTCSIFVFPQSPQGLNYQAVIRNNAGEFIA